MPMIYVKLYSYQIFRDLAYIHGIGVCHRDIEPQNLLVKGEPNISYICSRYYRAPELIFTTAIDMWSVGHVIAELLLGQVSTSLSRIEWSRSANQGAWDTYS